ncbi:MAG TPA: hypothetical protein PK280_00900 [Planctomycetota bacterium]|nr:hypothetical protein [Planctomycetota bacterium]
MKLKTICAGFALAGAMATAAWAGDGGNKPAGAKAPDPFNWGEAVDGLQLGLVPTGRGDTPTLRNVYFEGEGLKFALYLNNAGTTDLTMVHAALSMPDFRVLITPKDGGKVLVARYDAAQLAKDASASAATVRLPRGGHGNCPIEFDAKWRFEEAEGGATALKTLPVGKYHLQIVYEPKLGEKESGWKGRALTGSAEIEVRVRPAPSAAWSGGGGGGVGGGGGSGGGGGGGGGGVVPGPKPAPRPLPGPTPTM